jgi:crossover junction endodeoxyribonuclease RuvC
VPFFMGVDPGAKGAAAIISDKGKIHTTARFSQHTGPELAHWFRLSAGAGVIAVIEKVGAMPKQGRTSMFTFGLNTGRIQGFLDAFRYEWTEATPQVWQRRMDIIKIKTHTKEQHKKRLLQIAQRKWPGFKSHHAELADALLIADYCRKLHLGLLPIASQRKK